jgi:Rieske Fe-S protein
MTMNRRHFCAGTGLTVIGLTVVGCGSSDGSTDDMPGQSNDLAGKPDMGGSGSCSGQVNCGVLTLSVGEAMEFTDNNNYDFYVCRDAGGLYALSSYCTHSGCSVQQSGSGFYCPCHGATFAFDGSKPTYPARRSLPHYALCIDGSGHIQVDYNTTVAATVRV